MKEPGRKATGRKSAERAALRSLLEEAMESPIGLLVGTGNFDGLRAALYVVRKERKEWAGLQMRRWPGEDGEADALAICKGAGPSEEENPLMRL